MSPRAAHGFTLLEVLVAVFIMALVISFAFQAYQGIAEAYTRVSEVSSRDRSARILLDRIERELVGAVLIQREKGADPLLHPYFFFAEPRAYGEATGFELRFVTQTPLRSPGSPPAALALVTYSSTPSQTGHGLDLVRQEEPVPAQLVKQVEWTTPQTVAENVSMFLLRFTGETAQDGESWDSTTEAQLDQLPLSVEIAVSLFETAPDGEPWPGNQLSRSVSLPVRPFRLTAEAAEQGGCRDGVSVVSCLEGFAEELAAASPALAAAINDASAQAPDNCWNAPEPSPALQRLKALMVGLPGFNPAECR